MSSTQKPDLEESINVAEAHERVDREVAAAAREKRVDDQGSEPITLWVLAICGIVAVIAGGILGAGGRLFAYGDTFPENYVRSKAPGQEDTIKPKPILEAMIAKGAKVYNAQCMSCHGPDAKGNANYPSLVGSEWATGETERFAMIILNGLSGPISTGKTYPSDMPARIVSPEELATVMTYLRNSVNSTGDIVSIEMAQAAVDIAAKRENAGKPVNAKELADLHTKSLPGDPVDPTTLVNPITLEPVEAAAP